MNQPELPFKFLVKFFFTNKKHIPPGIPKREDRWEGTCRMVQEAAQLYAQGVIDKIAGRHRKGVVDTGEPIKLKRVNIAHLCGTILEKGYSILGLHYFYHEQKKKFVVVVELVAADADFELPVEIAQALRELFLTVWEYTHVWVNPPKEDGSTVYTINNTVMVMDDDERGKLVGINEALNCFVNEPATK